MQEYLDLHRHAAVRCELLNHQGIALRLCVAQIIASSYNFGVFAESQHTKNKAVKDSLAVNKASDIFDLERCEIRKLLSCEEDTKETIVARREDYGNLPFLYEVFAKLLELDDEAVMRILIFLIAETLSNSSAMVELLGDMLNVDMMEVWKPDQIFFDLLRDKAAINGMLKHIGSKSVADSNLTSTTKVQKGIIQDFINGDNGRKAKENFEPRYMRFPMAAYTNKGGINAIDQYKAIKKHYVS